MDSKANVFCCFSLFLVLINNPHSHPPHPILHVFFVFVMELYRITTGDSKANEKRNIRPTQSGPIKNFQKQRQSTEMVRISQYVWKGRNFTYTFDDGDINGHVTISRNDTSVKTPWTDKKKEEEEQANDIVLIRLQYFDHFYP